MDAIKTTINTFPMMNMKCAVCASSIERVLKSQPEVDQVSIDLEGAQVTIEYDDQAISKVELKRAVQSIGYDIEIDQ